MDGQSNSRQRRRIGIHHDLTPMVDVAMLLLTFFMLTAVLNRPRTMELNMPKGKVPIALSSVMTIAADQNNQWSISRGGEMPRSLSPVELRPMLGSAMAGDPLLVVIVSVHRSANYQELIDILDEVNLSAIPRFSVVPHGALLVNREARVKSIVK